MSRGEDVRVGSRQGAGRYLQISESARMSLAGRKKGGFAERKTQSQKVHASNGIGVTKQLSLQDFVRVAPGYELPSLEHLVLQDGKPGGPEEEVAAKESSPPTMKATNATGKSRKGTTTTTMTTTATSLLTNFAPKIAQSRFAEVFALSSYQAMSATAAGKDKKYKKGWAESVGVDGGGGGGGGGGAGHQHRSVPETGAREPASNDSYRLGASANVDLVHAAVLNFKSLRKSDRRSLDTLDDDMASARGQNVSILHLLGPPDPWDPPITTFADAGGSLRTAPKINSFRTSCSAIPPLNYQSDEVKVSGTLPGNCRKRDPGPSNSVNLFIASGVNSTGSLNSANRELSPVRWCDREVDGVYLGRSGWVQVQQRSLDESRRCVGGNGKTVQVSSTLPNRVKLSRYHFSSESGDHPDARKERPRPDYLPLPVEVGRGRESQKTPSPLSVQEYDSLSPPSITPIISPPPAFQDPGSEQNYHVPQPTRNPMGKPPFLSRSKAVMDSESPPNSPPNNWSSRNSRFGKKLTPSPASSSSSQQQHILLASQTKSLEDAASSGTRRNQLQRFTESSTSSSSSSFGFRSLDGSVGRSSAMPRLNETDSSVDGCDDEDGDDEYRRSRGGRMVSPPPESLANGDRVSPNNLRHRNSQRGHAGRRTPSSEANGKKYGARSPSSSSESCSSCERKSPNGNFRRFNQRQSRGESQANPWDVRNSRVRRSRSLQLPEKRSPGVAGGATPSSSGGSREHLSPDYPFYSNYKNGGTNSNHPGPYRVVVKVNGEAVNTSERARRYAPKKAQSEDAKYEELRREAEEETRIITEYLNSTRSRAAARDLLMHRYLNRPEESTASRGSPVSSEVAADPLYSVYFSGGRRPSQKKPPTQRNGSQAYAAGASPSNPNPCNPSTCDFWPHCAHRDAITYGKTAQSVTSPPNMRPSQSYPSTGGPGSQRKAADKSPRKPGPEDARKEGRSSRSSPASAESAVSDFDHPRGKSSGSIKSSPSDSRHSPCPKPQRQNSDKGRRKFDGVEIDGYPRKDEAGRRRGKFVASREDDASPASSSPSSASSSASEIYAVASSDRSKRSAKGSDASAGIREEYQSGKPDRAFSHRPGSAPADEMEEDLMALDAQRRSLSLPKSFLSNGYKNSKQSGLFPWRRQFAAGSNSTTATAAATASLRPLTPEVSKTAPATPVRDAGSGSKEKERSKQPQYVRSSSTPLLDDPPNANSYWDLRRDISQGTEESTKETNSRINQKELLGQRNTLGNQTSESVLQKFKKSFSLRFHKPQKGSAKDEAEDGDDAMEDGNEEEPQSQAPPPPAPAVEQKSAAGNPQTGKEDVAYDQKFRFGPLVWRSSKERKKGKKAVRNAKCNSGDSGIQIENSLHLPGDSSESHDTDQHDDLDSPPMIRRRTASAEKSSRPQSEVINQILIDKFKADLQWRAQSKGYPNRRVRRTNSDLGGQRLFNWELRNSYRRILSTPSPVKGRMTSRKASPEGPAALRGKRLPGRGQLRRSMSQPLGLNELSPLMRRKPSVVRNQILSEDEHDGRGATSDDEALSDSESSVTSLNDRKKSFEAAMDEEVVILAEAVWDHVAMEPEELAFRAGDVIEVLDTLDRDWWWGATGDNYGWFPSAFVRLRVSQEDTVEDCLEAMASGGQGTKQIRRRTSISLLSNDQVRSSVVRELLNTERDFVKVLRDVTEGYISECRRRTDMFTAEQIETIFGNLEDLLSFQTQFLEDLEVRVDREAPHRSCVGEIFLKHRAGFRMYSEYCNSHPMAIATLQELYQRNSYSKFFEACRLMRGLIEIPLDGYLLTPVQRICKYPLQLAELLKYTKPDHPDHHSVKEALETMRGVAVLINERKRRMESLEKLAAWQQRVEGWEGEDLIEVSTQLIYQGEAVRVTSGMWTSNITIFLFDHQLVYCKKDLLKRNTYVYKGRICMDTSEVIDIPDGKDPQSGVTIRHGLKIYSCIRDKWLLFCCRNGEEKAKWLDALAKERKLVAQDRQSGLELPPAARQLARMAARSKRRPPNEPRNKTYKRDSHYNGYKVGRKVGTWFTFGGAKKSSRMNLRTRNALQHVT